MANKRAKTVLVVDDSPLIIAGVQAALTSDGFQVRVAETLETMSQALEQGGVDLILMDVNMTEAFGDDAVAFLREERQIIHIPIYLHSDIDESDLAKRARSAGADGYICKGWGLPTLCQKVRAIVGNPS